MPKAPASSDRQIAALLALLMIAAPARGGDFPTTQWSIYVMNADGSGVRRVVHIEALPWVGVPRWSHDGRRLAFAGSDHRLGRALVVDTSGRNLIDLGRGANPDWSPDDKQLVTDVPGVGSGAVWVQNAGGRGGSWLATGRSPRWSPDGSQIAIGAPLRIMDVITGNMRRIPTGQDSDEAVGWDWSADGRQLAVVARRGDQHELIIVSARDPGQRPRVRWRGRLYGAPAWSPDGRRLAVTLHGSVPAERRICVLPVTGKRAPVPIPGQRGDNRDPAWSPTGGQLAFASTSQPDNEVAGEDK